MKKNIILIITIGIVCLLIGVGIGYVVYPNLNKETNNKEEKENTNNSPIKKELEELLIRNAGLKDDELENFIKTANIANFNEKYLGSYYGEEITEEFMILSSLANVIEKSEGEIFDNKYYDAQCDRQAGGAYLIISIETLNNVVKKYYSNFESYEIESTYDDETIKNGFFINGQIEDYGISVMCGESTCMIEYITGLAMGGESSSRYVNKIVDTAKDENDNTILTINVFYVEVSDDFKKATIRITHDDNNGKEYSYIDGRSGECSTATISSCNIGEYDELEKYATDYIKTYKITFDEKNRYVSSALDSELE